MFSNMSNFPEEKNEHFLFVSYSAILAPNFIQLLGSRPLFGIRVEKKRKKARMSRCSGGERRSFSHLSYPPASNLQAVEPPERPDNAAKKTTNVDKNGIKNYCLVSKKHIEHVKVLFERRNILVMARINHEPLKWTSTLVETWKVERMQQ